MRTYAIVVVQQPTEAQTREGYTPSRWLTIVSAPSQAKALEYCMRDWSWRTIGYYYVEGDPLLLPFTYDEQGIVSATSVPAHVYITMR